MDFLRDEAREKHMQVRDPIVAQVACSQNDAKYAIYKVRKVVSCRCSSCWSVVLTSPGKQMTKYHISHGTDSCSLKVQSLLR